MYWQAVDVLINILEASILVWFVYKKFGAGRFTWLTPCVAALVSVLLSLSGPLKINSFVMLLITVILLTFYTMLIARGNLLTKIFFCIVAVLLPGISDLLIVSLLSMITGMPAKDFIQTNLMRIQGAISSKALLFIFFFFLTRKKTSFSYKGQLWVFLYSIPIISMVVLFIFMKYQIEYHLQLDSMVVLTSGLALICIASIAIYDRLSFYTEMMIKQEAMSQQIKTQQTYIEEIRDFDLSFRGFRHDYANHMQSLRGILEEGKVADALSYLNEMGRLSEKDKIIINSGHPSVDALIGSKVARAIDKGIQIEYGITLPEELKVPAMEVCSVLGNLLDNAIEACGALASKGGGAYIWLEIGMFNQNIKVVIKNSFEGTILRSGGLFRSKKRETGHGIGLLNVRRIVDKHSGLIDFDNDGQVFTVRIMIPNH